MKTFLRVPTNPGDNDYINGYDAAPSGTAPFFEIHKGRNLGAGPCVYLLAFKNMGMVCIEDAFWAKKLLEDGHVRNHLTKQEIKDGKIKYFSLVKTTQYQAATNCNYSATMKPEDIFAFLTDYFDELKANNIPIVPYDPVKHSIIATKSTTKTPTQTTIVISQPVIQTTPSTPTMPSQPTIMPQNYAISLAQFKPVKHKLTAEETATTEIIDKISRLFASIQKFDFVHSIRTFNTIYRLRDEGYKEMANHFYKEAELSGHPQTDEIKNICASSEMYTLMKDLANISGTGKIVNKRLVVLYGEAGTGKSTTAINYATSYLKKLGYDDAKIKETMESTVYNCKSTETDDSFLRYFKIENGTNCLVDNLVVNKMEEGLPLILEEIGSWDQDTINALKILTDERTVFYSSQIGRPIHIKDGFKIIVAMNLYDNDGIHPLPTPIVDRCEAIVKYEGDNSNIAKYAF